MVDDGHSDLKLVPALEDFILNEENSEDDAEEEEEEEERVFGNKNEEGDDSEDELDLGKRRRAQVREHKKVRRALGDEKKKKIEKYYKGNYYG